LPITFRIFRDGHYKASPLPDDLAPLLADPKSRFWVDLDNVDVPTLESIGRRFGFHDLAIEDCHHNVQRPKIDEYPGYLFFSFHAVDETGEGDVKLREMDGFLAKNFIVTVHEEPSPEVVSLTERCDRNPRLIEKGVDNIFYELLDRMVDTHFPILDRIEERLGEAEERVFHTRNAGVLEDLFHVRKEILALRRIVGPQREILNVLSNREWAVISDGVRPYLRDVQDHLIRLTDIIDTYRDLSTSAMEAYRSEVSQRLNQVMKKLAVIGTIGLPLTVTASLWGMNFRQIPLADHPSGFWIVAGALALVAVTLLGIFRKTGWF
jgi:magnesium transporter